MPEIHVTNRRYNALMVVGIILPLLLYPLLSLVFLSPKQDFYQRILYSRFLIWTTLGLMVLYAQQAEVQRFLLWPSEKYRLLFYLKTAGVLYLLTIAAGIISTIPGWFGWHDDNVMLRKLQLVMQQHPVLLVFGAITAGITEELIFRGYIISRLSLMIKNKYLPIIISAFLFAMIHIGYKSLKELIFAFSIGIVFGYHYQKYRNIYVLIIIHSLIDLIAFIIPGISHK